MFGFEGFFDVRSMGMFSKMTTMKVLEVVWEVSGCSGEVGIWSLRALAHFRNFLEVDLRQSPRCQMPISHFQKSVFDNLTIVTIDLTIVVTVVVSSSSSS